MEIIPLIHFKNRKIQTTKDGEDVKLDDFLKKYPNLERIYILDHDGIKKEKPNLYIYPKLSEKYEIWVDSKPVVLGDIFDNVMAGASILTIRSNLWKTLDIDSIKEITENKIFAQVDLTVESEQGRVMPFFDQIDGIVIFNDKNQLERDYKGDLYLKELSARYKTYAYETSENNRLFWEKRGIQGLLIDLGSMGEVKKK